MLDALETLPKSSDQFFWTDFAELRALIHPDRCYSSGDLSGLENRSADTDADTDKEADKKNFKSEKRWRELITFAGIREHAFGSAYPFRVTEDEDTLELNFDEHNSEQVTYLNLLLASLMRHIPNAYRGDLARHFEVTCFAVFTKLMPEGSEVRATWAGGGDEAPYRGSLYEKMQQIAADLRCTANFNDRDFKKNDNGDGGIDLISWHPMADDREGMPVSFAQCGCSKDQWRFKQLEASPSKHSRHLPMMHLWATYYFMPLDLRHPDGGWANESDIGQAIIVDRLRLVRLASKYNLHDTLPDLPLLDTVREIKYL